MLVFIVIEPPGNDIGMSITNCAELSHGRDSVLIKRCGFTLNVNKFEQLIDQEFMTQQARGLAISEDTMDKKTLVVGQRVLIRTDYYSLRGKVVEIM